LWLLLIAFGLLLVYAGSQGAKMLFGPLFWTLRRVRRPYPQNTLVGSCEYDHHSAARCFDIIS
jgi:hypothetical protein